jgi:hypothetical protein
MRAPGWRAASILKASSISDGLVARNTSNSTPRELAACWRSCICRWALVGFTSAAISRALGTSCRSSPNTFVSTAAVSWITPVAFRPGRLMLDASPSATGSPPPIMNTIGRVDVAFLAAIAAVVLLAKMMVTGRRTNSAAKSGIRS